MPKPKKPIIIRQIKGGIGQQGYGYTWRAYGVNNAGKEFWLIDRRYAVLYPLDASTEKQLRRLCTKQYPKHPITTLEKE